ncbi:hypothetical protein SAMN02799624_05258 [Paenibacillus sp. UNC496MF]|uniref:hypothetical protein n=1 Tax=Paenibacillus sp. UNC496MF TaxID=1502753 RepID=UPI0008E2F57E|nr:hypothetical protein [Paenibacillus sp. UNC496MF]SFJ63034.1 hypothetical protein SAMN02799624_05258 [Paenibacillus sp. UNC496MF]
MHIKLTCCFECGPTRLIPPHLTNNEINWIRCAGCREKNRAFYRDFWSEYVDAMNNGDRLVDDGRIVARINGEHYVIGFEDEKGYFRGHGGNTFVLRFTSGPHAGQTYRTTNLWAQGKISHGFEKILTDNAVFVPQVFASLLEALA